MTGPEQNVNYASSQKSTFLSAKRTQISEKNKDLEHELASLRKSLEQLETPVKEPIQLGKGVTICGNCHHRGHRNDSRHACEYVKCIGFHYCGYQKLHPEHTQKINDLKRQIKRLEEETSKGNETLQTIANFESKSETYFFSEMLPRLKAVDTLRYQNKTILFKDLRILKSAFNSKVPEVKPNDKTFLKSTLESERTKIAQTSSNYVLEDDDTGIDDVNKSSPIRTQCSKRALSYETNPETRRGNDTSSGSSSDWSSSDSMNENYDRYSKHNSSHRRRRKRPHKRKHHKQTSQDVRLVSYHGLHEKEPATVSTQVLNVNNQSKTYFPTQTHAQISNFHPIAISSPETAGRSLDTVNPTENSPHATVHLHVNQNTQGSRQYLGAKTRLDVNTLLYAASLQDEHFK